MSDGGLTPEQFAAEMEEAATKFDVQQGDDTTLLLDLDTPASRVQFLLVFPKMSEQFGVDKVLRWKSKSGNTHVAITLVNPEPLSVRVALQAALGSDGVRELLTLKRAANGCVEPSRLFRPRDSIVEVLDPEDVAVLF